MWRRRTFRFNAIHAGGGIDRSLLAIHYTLEELLR